MKRSFLIFIILIVTVLTVPVIGTQAAVNQENTSVTKDVLLIYDQLAVNTVYRDNLNAVETLLSTLSRTAEIVAIDD